MIRGGSISSSSRAEKCFKLIPCKAKFSVQVIETFVQLYPVKGADSQLRCQICQILWTPSMERAAEHPKHLRRR